MIHLNAVLFCVYAISGVFTAFYLVVESFKRQRRRCARTLQLRLVELIAIIFVSLIPFINTAFLAFALIVSVIDALQGEDDYSAIIWRRKDK